MSFRCLRVCAALMVLQGSVCGNKFDDLIAESTKANKRWTAIPTASPVATNRGTSWGCTLDDKAYVFGGLSSPPNATLLDDLWAYDFVSLQFSEIVTSVRPPPRQKHKLLCDEKRQLIYLVGGKHFEDMWIFDLKLVQWRMVPTDPANGLTFDIFGSDFVALATNDYVLIVGTEDGLFADWLKFDKKAEVWLPRAYDGRLKLEDPGAVGVGNYAVVVGGSSPRKTLSHNTFVLDTSDPQASWELRSTAIYGEEFHMQWLYNHTLALMGDPGGKGMLGRNEIALMDLDQPDGDWVTVDRSDDWMPLITDFVTTQYKGNIMVIGGTNFSSTTAVLPSHFIYVYNPRVCKDGCNGNGRCELGNCVDCVGHSGIACEVPDPVATDYTPIIVGASVGAGVFFLVFAVVTWKASAKYRAFRKLYATSSVAENMAEQIACMELEKLDYLNELEHPTRVQASFITIVSTLKTYRMYLPESVLQKVSRAAEYEVTTCDEGATCTPEPPSDLTLRSSSRSADPVVSRSLDLAAKVARKRVSTATFELGRYSKWVAERGTKGDTAAIYACAETFADAVQSIVSQKGGTILEAQLGSGCIICAWNFQKSAYSPDVAAMDASLEIMDATQTTLPLPLHVAVTTGPAWAGNLGGSNLRVPVLVGHHQCISDILMKSAMARQVSVATNCESLQDHFKLVPIDIVSSYYDSKSGTAYQLPPEQAPSVWVFKVLGAFADDGQEWMYGLDKREKASGGLMDVMAIYEAEGAAAASDLLDKVLKGLDDERREQAKLLTESLTGTIPAIVMSPHAAD